MLYLIFLLQTLCLYIPLKAEISYLQISSEEIDSSEYGVLAANQKDYNCQCGWSNKVGSRIVGGNTALPNEFPFAVAIMDKFNHFLFCGGTIISNNHVITGAHCTWNRVLERDPMIVAVGEHDVIEESSTRQIIDVNKVIQHPNFNKITLKNDVAILVLQEKINFNQFIGPACLPTTQENLDHKYVRIIGWGSVQKDWGTSSILKKVDVRVVPINTCSYNYPGQVNPASPTQICTFGRRKGSCQGDSGGPVVWLDPKKNRYTLIGLVSFGKSRASTIPTVNTDVYSYIDWIKTTMQGTGHTENKCLK